MGMKQVTTRVGCSELANCIDRDDFFTVMCRTVTEIIYSENDIAVLRIPQGKERSSIRD